MTEPDANLFRTKSKNIRIVVRMMDRMKAGLEHMPELDKFRQIPEEKATEGEMIPPLMRSNLAPGYVPSARVKFLNDLLLQVQGPPQTVLYGNQEPFQADFTLPDEKANLIRDLWRHVTGVPRTIPIKGRGEFGKLHSRYGHVFQIISMLKGSTPEEQEALREVLLPPNSFLFFWSLIFDSREGGANDPASWKKYETP